MYLHIYAKLKFFAFINMQQYANKPYGIEEVNSNLNN